MGNLQQALSFRPFAPEEVNLETFQILSRGINKGRRVKLFLRNLGADRAQSGRGDPCHLACVDNRRYIIGCDTGRKGTRTFALSRMKKAELLNDTFEIPKDFQIDDYLRGSRKEWAENWSSYQKSLPLNNIGIKRIRGG